MDRRVSSVRPPFRLRSPPRTAEQSSPVAAAHEGQREQVLNAYAKLPIAFVENRGQMDARVRYYAEGPRYAFYLTRDELVLSFMNAARHAPDARGGTSPGVVAAATSEPAQQGIAISLRFLGGNPRAVPESEEPAAGEVNYFRGNDPARWQTSLPRYRQIVYRELWPGVDLSLRDQDGTLKYQFRVRPGARIADIGLAYRGSNGLALDAAGALLIKTDMGVLRDSPPVAYQTIAGARVPVESRYVLTSGRRPLRVRGGRAISRTRSSSSIRAFEYATFLGGASHDVATGIAVDAAGNAYVSGWTQSPDFPTRPGSFRRTGATGNFSDVFVSKLNAAGTALVYSTFIGGSNFDFGRRMAIDAAGNVYVTGQTKSSNFPTTGGAFDRTFNIANCPRCGIDQEDTFVTKLNAAGSALVYSTFIGGTDMDDARGIAVDGAGNAYVIGETASRDFPTTAGAFNRVHSGAYDVFVTKLNATGSALAYSTFLGGTQVDDGERIAVDAGGNAYAMGFTSSTDFPTTAGAFDTTANGAFDVFVTKLNAAGSALLYSTYLGGSGFDTGGGLDRRRGRQRVRVGRNRLDSTSRRRPARSTRVPDGSDAFVTKLNPAGSALAYSAVFGGTARGRRERRGPG